ncbi:DUF2637 domain-containing protein [Streptantibioticus ferralitis]|uniref:DUF2637 domain-containing protein n=1 Tax=Streptantibioticus ferralitis TaxID=236510 RepID=A0ABT5ZB72_9ACTN|nr:DUF2637 domain-containing protein [Streptantibioticus ferralitis]MDF2260280.1 DUF2637 domain-containing protein [Streptantibioticus ferralitis]
MRGYRGAPGDGWDTAGAPYGTTYGTSYDTYDTTYDTYDTYDSSYGAASTYGAASSHGPGTAYGAPSTYRMPLDEPSYEASYEASFEAPYAAPCEPVYEAPHFAPEPLDGQDLADAEVFDGSWDFDADLAQLLQSAAPEPTEEELDDDCADPPPPAIPRQRGARRRPSRLIRLVGLLRAMRPKQFPWLRVLSLVIAAATAVLVAMLSVLGGVISYDPLRRLASPDAPQGVVALWPLLVYGPWMVGSLSILRAAVHRRRAGHSWAVVVMFSAIAVYLCVAHAPRTVLGMAVAGLPPVTALVSFHQLVRQITLTNPPRHALPRQRHGRG